MSASDLIRAVDERRRVISNRLDATERALLGQFFTPSPVAQFIASLPTLPPSGRVRILDPGAGIGSLTAALVCRIISERPDLEVAITAFEIDESLRPELEMTLNGCYQLAKIAGCRLSVRLIGEDFLEWTATVVSSYTYSLPKEQFDIVILNPPYRKVSVTASERLALRQINVEITNLYVAFLAMSVALLDEAGQLAAITPRSFTNGPYFRSFRRYFFDNMRFDHLHLYESRSKTFAEDAVLQENVIFGAHRRRNDVDSHVTISTSKSPSEITNIRKVLHSDIVSPDDPEQFVHITTDEADAELGRLLVTLPTRLSNLGFEVSTGRVVDFRAKEHLRYQSQPGTISLIYPGHLRDGGIAWPGNLRKKPSWIMDCKATASLFLPTETYVVVKRFTAKEERRRVVASVFDPSDIPSKLVAFENHLNVFHVKGHGLSPDIARGLAAWLNSTVIDRYLRCFNGHTQINATDLRRLPFPASKELQCLGATLGAAKCADQDKIDGLVTMHV
ncbi:MAG: N-6 DNA methylase, partial [Acidimicrobiales bacterium]|nr:N-6 DNA methylase [Acidimicrobiales bacterium]